MTFQDVESMFSRALSFSFSKKKGLLVIPTLMICGLIKVLFYAVGFQTETWLGLSLSLFPWAFSFGIVLALGILLNRLYYREVKGVSLSYQEVLTESLPALVRSVYFSLPCIFRYLCLWMVIGLFHLFHAMPFVGHFFSVILSFAPFTVIFAMMTLVAVSCLVLFFVTPYLAVKKEVGLEQIKLLLAALQKDFLTNASLFVIGIIPPLVGAMLLNWTASLTASFFPAEASSAALALQSFFMMIPFVAFLSPLVVFFFNFSMESYSYMRKRLKYSS